MTFNQAYKELNIHKKLIGKQAYKTFLGQLKSGNIDGTLKGYVKLLKNKYNIEHVLTKY